jgi:hypothetical protein
MLGVRGSLLGPNGHIDVVYDVAQANNEPMPILFPVDRASSASLSDAGASLRSGAPRPPRGPGGLPYKLPPGGSPSLGLCDQAIAHITPAAGPGNDRSRNRG